MRLPIRFPASFVNTSDGDLFSTLLVFERVISCQSTSCLDIKLHSETGTLGLLWSVLAFFLMTDSPSKHPRISVEEKQYLLSYSQSKAKAWSFIGPPWRHQLKLLLLEFAEEVGCYSVEEDTTLYSSLDHHHHQFLLLCCFQGDGHQFTDIYHGRLGLWRCRGIARIGHSIVLCSSAHFYFVVLQIGIFSALPLISSVVIHLAVGPLFDYVRVKRCCSLTAIRKTFNLIGRDPLP